MNDYLDEPFTDGEVKRAPFDMGGHKAPGPDGFHAAFFQCNWDVVRLAVSKACLGVLNNGADVAARN